MYKGQLEGFPKVMMVSDYPIDDRNKGRKLVVFTYQPTFEYPYFAYHEITSIDQIEELNTAFAQWKYAKDVEPEPEFPSELQAILDEKAKEDNHICLNTYAKGLLDCYIKLVKK